MKIEQKEKIKLFLEDQLSKAEFRVKAYVYNESGVPRLSRNAFLRLRMHLDRFLQRSSSVRWVVMFGLRGAGKTTLLAQMYTSVKADNRRKLFLSVDQVTQVFGVSLKDVIDVYEEMLGTPFEQLREPVFLFLDEVQYDPKWATLLKSIYDRSTRIFITTTGSSALSLQASPDVARRAIFERLYPMSFCEYVKIKHNRTEIKGLSLTLRKAIFSAKNAGDLYTQLKKIETEVRKYWNGIEQKDVDAYMRYGTLPFMIALNNEALVYDQIKKTLERVVSVDIPHIAKFSPEIISKIPMILYAIAESDELSLTGMANKFDISRPVIGEVLDTLEKTETIHRIYPHGSHMNQAKKASKYLFASPAFRAMYFNFIGNITTENNYKGKLLEDTVGLYLNRIFNGKPGASLTYDSASGGADFIVRQGDEHFVVEVGYGEKNFDQVILTMNKQGLAARYGIIISQSPLFVDTKKNIVSIPLSYFLLT